MKLRLEFEIDREEFEMEEKSWEMFVEVMALVIKIDVVTFESVAVPMRDIIRPAAISVFAVSQNIVFDA